MFGDYHALDACPLSLSKLKLLHIITSTVWAGDLATLAKWTLPQLDTVNISTIDMADDEDHKFFKVHGAHIIKLTSYKIVRPLNYILPLYNTRFLFSNSHRMPTLTPGTIE